MTRKLLAPAEVFGLEANFQWHFSDGFWYFFTVKRQAKLLKNTFLCRAILRYMYVEQKSLQELFANQEEKP